MKRPPRVLLSLLLVLCCACDSSDGEPTDMGEVDAGPDPEVRLIVRTDLVPGREWDELHLEIGTPGSLEGQNDCTRESLEGAYTVEDIAPDDLQGDWTMMIVKRLEHEQLPIAIRALLCKDGVEASKESGSDAAAYTHAAINGQDVNSPVVFTDPPEVDPEFNVTLTIDRKQGACGPADEELPECVEQLCDLVRPLRVPRDGDCGAGQVCDYTAGCM